MKKFKFASVFFCVTFIFSIFCFELVMSTIEAKKISAKKYSAENNKSLSFNNIKNLRVKDIYNIIYEKDLTIGLTYYISELNDKENSGYELTTKMKSNKFDIHNNMIENEYLSEVEFQGKENIGLTTLQKEEIILTTNRGKKINIEKIGTISNEVKSIIVPQKIFFDYVGNDFLGGNNMVLSISGEGRIVEEAISTIKTYLADKESEMSIHTFPPMDMTIEVNFLIKAAALVVIITILNSVCITSLWVDERRQDLVLRKVCGAKDRDIFNIYFKELSILSLCSFVVATLLYSGFLIITNNSFMGIKMEFSAKILVITFVATIAVTYLASMPCMRYIRKIEICNLLKEE